MQASSSLVSDFLLELHSKKQRALSTLEGYWMAISGTLRHHSGLDLGHDPVIKALLRNVRGEQAKRPSAFPTWDLSLVLRRLTMSPFEPLGKASDKHLTFKAIFLVALASGKRRGEVHAFQNSLLRRPHDWSFVELRAASSFISKTQMALKGPKCLLTCRIPSLSATLDRSMTEDRSLCPVRALRFYLERVAAWRGDRTALFVSMKKGHKGEIAPATISSWLRKTVLECYQLAQPDDLTVTRVKAHDVRALSTSLAFHRQASFEQIIQAGRWSNHSTFTEFYLKDLSLVEDSLLSLGPLVSAETVV